MPSRTRRRCGTVPFSLLLSSSLSLLLSNGHSPTFLRGFSHAAHLQVLGKCCLVLAVGMPDPYLSTAEQLEHHGRNFCGFALDGGQLGAGGSWHGLEGMESWKHTIIGIGPTQQTKPPFSVGIFPATYDPVTSWLESLMEKFSLRKTIEL